MHKSDLTPMLQSYFEFRYREPGDVMQYNLCESGGPRAKGGA